MHCIVLFCRTQEISTGALLLYVAVRYMEYHISPALGRYKCTYDYAHVHLCRSSLGDILKGFHGIF